MAKKPRFSKERSEEIQAVMNSLRSLGVTFTQQAELTGFTLSTIVRAAKGQAMVTDEAVEILLARLEERVEERQKVLALAEQATAVSGGQA